MIVLWLLFYTFYSFTQQKNMKEKKRKTFLLVSWESDGKIEFLSLLRWIGMEIDNGGVFGPGVDSM